MQQFAGFRRENIGKMWITFPHGLRSHPIVSHTIPHIVRIVGNMASIRKHKTGWRAQVAKSGVRRSKVFPSRQEARDWAARQEYEIANGAKIASAKLFSEVLDRYAREVSPAKKGHRWEEMRIASFARDKIGRKPIGKLSAEDFSDWRDRRLREVSPGTVRREMVLLSAILNVARKEWGLLTDNPLADVRRPTEPPPRDRLVTDDEIERMAYVAGDDLTVGMARAFHAFLFALETGMRMGEIVSLTPARVDLDKRVAHLPMTKNGTARSVPLSSEAVRLIRALPPAPTLFGLTAPQLESLWRKVRDRAGVTGLTFHDSRHSAITRLSRKLDVLALARMVGHKNISQLLTYFNEDAEDLAKRLD